MAAKKNATDRKDSCKCGQTLEHQDLRCPQCGQQRIDFTTRGSQRRLLDAWKPARSYPSSDGRSVSGSAVKSVLRAIDDRITLKQIQWKTTRTNLPISLSEIIEYTGCSDRVVRRALLVLIEDLHLVSGEKVMAGSSPCWELGVCWSLLCEAVDSPSAEEGIRPRRLSTRPLGTAHPATAHVSRGHSGRTIRPPGTGHPATVAVSTSIDAFKTHPRITHTPPDPPPATGGGEEEIWKQRKRASLWGLRTAHWLVPQVSQLCGVDHVRELLDHFEAHRHRPDYTIHALYHRLQNALPGLPVDQAWDAAPNRTGSAPAQDLEQRFGPRLDAMSDEEFWAFGRRSLAGNAGALGMLRMCSHRREVPTDLRRLLLKALAAEA